MGVLGEGERLAEVLKRDSQHAETISETPLVLIVRGNQSLKCTYWASSTGIERAIEAFAFNLKFERGISRPF